MFIYVCMYVCVYRELIVSVSFTFVYIVKDCILYSGQSISGSFMREANSPPSR